MGRRAAGETMAAIVAAFARRSCWEQRDLAAEADTTVRVVRQHLLALGAAGLDVEREEQVTGDAASGWVRVYWTWRTTIRGEPRRRRYGAPRR